MHCLIVMDHTGDSRHYFDATNSTSVTEARARFEKLNKAGYIAAKRTGNGTSEVIRQFDPTLTRPCSSPGSSADDDCCGLPRPGAADLRNHVGRSGGSQTISPIRFDAPPSGGEGQRSSSILAIARAKEAVDKGSLV
jgi:hypothetical protein